VFNISLHPRYLLLQIFGIHGFLKAEGTWFISAIVACYSLFPFFAQSYINAKNKYTVVIFWIGMCLVVSLCITPLHSYHYLLDITLRIPSFIIGSVIGYLISKPGYVIRINASAGIYALMSLCCLVFIFFIFYYYSPDYSKNRWICLYPCIVLVFPFTFLAALGIEFLKTTRLFSFPDRFLNIMGMHSLELYLYHSAVFMTIFFPTLFPKTRTFWNLMPQGNAKWFCAIVVSIVLAVIFRSIFLMPAKLYEIVKK
jgi:hypothetical protein